MSHLAHCIFRLVLASLALARHTNSIVRANVGEIRSSGDAPRQSSHTESGPGEGPSSLRELGRRRQRRTLRRSRYMGTPAAAKSEGEEEEGNGFPKVFSAIVLTPPPEMSASAGGDVSGINQNRDAPGVNFLSEVDLMYYATAERDDDDVEAHGGTDVFFMVHSQRELDYLTSVADNTTTMGAFGSNSSSTRQRAAVDASSIRFNAHRTEELQTAAAAVRQGRSNARARVIEEEEEAGTGEEEVVPKYSTIPGHSCFRNLAGMHTFLQDLNSTTGVNSKPDLIVNVRDIGDSYLKTQDAQRGYDILAINITGNGVPVADHDDAATTTTTTKKGMFLALFGSHAREYAPPELGARFAEMLIGGYGTDADITSILDRTEVHLILHVNPDGREIAEGGVFQRKNMHDYSEIKTCDEEDIGVDLNRNFPFKWGLDSGSSSNPCSAGYRGPYAASEPETRAVMDYALAIFPEGQRKVGGDDLALNEAYDEISTSGVFFDVHAHGGLNLYPFSFEERLPPNGDGLRTIARKLRRYNGHRIIDFWYEASGTTGDWAYAALGAATQIFEIGDEDFQDCETFEHDIASGNLEALLYATRLARAPYSIAKGLDVIDVALSSTSIDIVEVGSFLTVSVDVEGSSSSSKMGGQSTFVVKLFVDMHPYDRRVVSGSLRPEQPADNATTVYSSWERQAGVEMKLTTGDAGKTQTANFSMSYFQLLSLLGPPTVAGRHVLHLQGTDNDTGNPGPVKSVYFDVYNSTSEGSLREWTVLTSDHFEFGWGNWSDGGKYARRYVGANYKNGGYAHTGTTAIEVRGDFGTDSSVVHKHNLDVRSFVHLRMTFSFYVRRFDNKDEFFLDLSNDGGESWGTVKSWRHEEDIESDRMYKDEVVVMNSTVYDFSDSLRLRFRSDASSKEESVYIDDVELAGRR